MATLLAVSACGSFAVKPPIVGYTCCNLRSELGWISSNNVQDNPIVPAGEKVMLDSVRRRFYIYGTVGGVETGWRDDNSETEADALKWARSIVVAENPRPVIASWPADVRLAVQYGKARIGMSKTQVLVSLGYPAKSDTADIKGAVWRYWTAKDDLPVDLRFDENDKLVDIVGAPSAVQAVSSVQ